MFLRNGVLHAADGRLQHFAFVTAELLQAKLRNHGAVVRVRQVGKEKERYQREISSREKC